MARINNISESSVQKRDQEGYWKSTILRLAATYDIIPDWWTPSRDAFFRGYWYQENFLASAIYAIANRNAAFGWEITGLDDDIQPAQHLLQFAEFGDGWQPFVIKTSMDLLLQDNGAFVEVIRPARVNIDGKKLHAVKEYYESDNAEWFAFDENKRIALKNKSYNVYDSPYDLPIGLAHLDAGQCQRTGDSDTPVIYTDRDGKQHAMKWWQVLMFNEMPSPIEKMNGVGYCACSRLFRASHIMQSISLYNDEKVSGRFNRAVHLTNVDPETINDAIKMSGDEANNLGLLRYSQPIVAATLSPNTPVSLETINLAEVPDNFQFNDLQNWYIANLALALGVDYGFLAPLPGKGLGTASQSETMARQSRGKSSRLFMDMISNALNFKGVLPQSIQFRFTEEDTEEEINIEKSRKLRSERFKTYSENGWVTPTVIQQMLSDSGDVPDVYLEQMGQEDTTPVTTTSGDENIEAQETQEEEIISGKGFTNYAFYSKVKKRKLTLFKNKSFFERLKNVARKAIRKKQVEIPQVENQELQDALDLYSEELEEIVLQANSGEITKEEFENKLAELVILSLTAFYVETSGIDPEDFTSENEEVLENYISVNLESVGKLANDIYDGRYQDTEDRDGTLMVLGRLGLWVSNAYALATIGMISSPKVKEKNFKFVLGDTHEHCADCLRLNGQVHTAGEWLDHPSMLPRSHDLECKGFKCLCFLVEIDKPVSGNF